MVIFFSCLHCCCFIAGRNNGFPVLDILGYLKNTHKNPKFGRVRQVPIRELGWEFPGWDLPNLGFLWVFFKYPKISKNGNPLFFPVYMEWPFVLLGNSCCFSLWDSDEYSFLLTNALRNYKTVKLYKKRVGNVIVSQWIRANHAGLGI